MGLDRKLQYHSMSGCCICGTKTSSSRFTSSTRFESLFAPCFGITYDDQRSGDICNACVLIVKRFRNNPQDSCKNWAHIIGSKVGPGHRTTRRQKAAKHHETNSCVRPKPSKPSSRSVGLTSHRIRRTPSPMRLRHPKRFTVKPDPMKRKPGPGTKYRAIAVGCGRRAKVFRRRPVRRSRSFPLSNQLIDTDYWKSVSVCCGSVYKSESNDLILIDVAKFRPCQRRHHGGLAHLTAVARNAEVGGSSSSHVSVSASYNSAGSLSTHDGDQIDQSSDFVRDIDQDANFPTQLPSSVSADYEEEDEDEYEDNDESCSILQTDESMEAESPSQDTDDEVDTLPASAMAATHRSILCNLLWNNRRSQPNDLDNQSDFVWSESVDSWPSPHTLSKSSTVKVFP